MQRASPEDRQVERLRATLFTHSLAEELGCAHTGYALGRRLEPEGAVLCPETWYHKWCGRLKGACISRQDELQRLLHDYPRLEVIWNDPLWEALKQHGTAETWASRFDARVQPDDKMRSFTNASMIAWVGVPEPQRLVDLLILLRDQRFGLGLQRLWVLKNMRAYLLVVSAFPPFSWAPAELYGCIRRLPGNERSAKWLSAAMSDSPEEWRKAVECAKYHVDCWMNEAVGRTQSGARGWLWDGLNPKAHAC